jgi:hypothetical protein
MLAHGKTENGMLIEFRGRSGRRDRLLFTCRAIVPTVTILMAAVSCSTIDGPQPRADVCECEPSFFDRITVDRVAEAVNPQSVQRGEGQPKVQRAQPKTSASPKVATEHTPKATGASVARPASKKAKAAPRLDDQLDDQRERQLFREFLEWRNRQKELR